MGCVMIGVRDFLLLNFVFFTGNVRNVHKKIIKEKIITELPEVILKNHTKNVAYFYVILNLHSAYL